MNEAKLKELEEEIQYLTRDFTNDNQKWSVSQNLLSDLITAYRQLEKEAKEDECPYCKLLMEHEKTIAELRTLLKRVEPSMATTRELYRDITKVLYREHKGE